MLFTFESCISWCFHDKIREKDLGGYTVKKLLLLISILSLSLLTGCFSFNACELNPEQDKCAITYTPLVDDNSGDIQSLRTLSVVDLADYYEITPVDIHLFSYATDPDTPYVDVEEFLFVIQDALTYYTVSVGDTFQLNYKVYYGPFASSFYEYNLELDPVENTVYYTDFAFASEFNANPSVDYTSDLQVVNSDYSGDNLEWTIDLDDYDFQIVLEDGHFFLPLFLANLFLTGSQINVYENGDSLYVIDDFSLAADIIQPSQSSLEVTNEGNLIQNTLNYLSLFFDNFYGLKNYYGVESYSAIFQEWTASPINDIRDLDTLIDTFIYQLDDLHTQVITYGYDGADILGDAPAQDSRLMNFIEVYTSDVCYNRTEEAAFNEFNEYYILELNEFTLDTQTFLGENLVNLDSSKPIYIDLACNPGGNLVAILELLTYLSTNPIPFTYMNPFDGEWYHEEYQVDPSRGLANDFYIFTSNMTYSAANVFTAIANDNDLAPSFGQKSGGGGCSVLYTVFPNQMVMTYSSDFAITSEDLVIYEDGVEPDYLTSSYDLTAELGLLYGIFPEVTNIQVLTQSTANGETFTMSSETVPSEYTVDKVVVEVIDIASGTVLSTTDYSSMNFEHSETYTNYTSPFRVKITVYYTFEIFNLRYTAYNTAHN